MFEDIRSHHSFVVSVGFNLDPERKITTYGSPSLRTAYTAKIDIGRSLVRLATLALSSDPAVSSTVPEHVRIAGSNLTLQEVKVIIARESGQEIAIETLDLDDLRESLKRDVLAGRVQEGEVVRHLQ